MINDDDFDEEEIWDGMCKTIAGISDLSATKVKAMLADAGFHAFGHCGIEDANEIVAWLKKKR